MNQIYKYTGNFLLVALLVTGLGSCKDSFLEILPKGITIATTTSDYDAILNQLDLINTNSNSQILLGDEVTTADPSWTGTTFKEKQLFKWEGDLYNPGDDDTETPVQLRNLYFYNQVINEVMDSKDGDDLTKKSLQGEAYAGRALNNFLLIQYFGKPYNPATAATDLGFPLITKSDINAIDFKRATVQQIYDQIISDLTIAIPNIKSDGVFWRGRMSKCAAQFLLGKVYVFMGRYADALPLLNAAVANLSKSTVSTTLVNYNTTFTGPSTVIADVETVFAKNMNPHPYGINGAFSLTPEAASLYKSTDARLTQYFATVVTYSPPAPAAQVKLRKRVDTYSYNIGLKVPDLYLLRAEVNARLDDPAGAVADLQLLRTNRMPTADVAVPAAALVSKSSLVKFVIEERLREFAITGYRWFDMRRLSVDPLFSATTYQHVVYSNQGVVTQTFTLKPERFQFKFSPKVLAQNPSLTDNP